MRQKNEKILISFTHDNGLSETREVKVENLRKALKHVRH